MSCRSRGSPGGTCRPLTPPTGSLVASPGSPEMCVCVLGVGVCVCVCVG